MTKTEREVFTDFSDKQIYEGLCRRDPYAQAACDMFAEMRLTHGLSTDEIMHRVREDWSRLHVWDEDEEFRWRLILRGTNYLVARMSH